MQLTTLWGPKENMAAAWDVNSDITWARYWATAVDIQAAKHERGERRAMCVQLSAVIAH